MAISPDDLVVLTHAATEPESALIVGALENNGIEAAAQGGLTSALRAEVPSDVSIVVRHRDLDRARRILADCHDNRPDIDPAADEADDRQ